MQTSILAQRAFHLKTTCASVRVAMGGMPY